MGVGANEGGCLSVIKSRLNLTENHSPPCFVLINLNINKPSEFNCLQTRSLILKLNIWWFMVISIKGVNKLNNHCGKRDAANQNGKNEFTRKIR